MQPESLTTSNCPAWPVGAVKSEREQTTRRLAISSGTARGALTPGGLTFARPGRGMGGASSPRVSIEGNGPRRGREDFGHCKGSVCILDDALNYDN